MPPTWGENIEHDYGMLTAIKSFVEDAYQKSNKI
jgi:hypothetical protein